ncbi:uncharacterized protein LOC113170584 [Anabas testudineus]|uniref:BHLH domain-containing protein n=1 Tax=Anabas testudineus TaxID=64144 RepID=A0A3Q1HQE4_ANATE|nr:uncharacterized protein LOC113170584 [Anabas testudineus]
MKLLQDTSDSKSKSKILKPQVERRRRERMNRSLDTLKSLLLQRQEETQRRVEKAEILEHTVLFLQDAAKGGGGGGGHKHSFQDGFSTCLQRATHFLGPHGKGLWLEGALDASFTSRFASSNSADDQKKSEASSSSSLLLRKSCRAILQMLIHRSQYRMRIHAQNVGSCVQTRRESNRFPTTPHQPHKVTSPAKSLWRPWP